jgi:hypothetical protein
VTDIELVPWRLAVEAAAGRTEQVLTRAFGPDRVRDVRVGHDIDGVTVTFATTERDPIWLVWEVVTQMARVWPAFDALVALTVHAGDVTVRTTASAMEAVSGGGRYAAWRAGISVSID